MAPPCYGDLGKSARDLFSKGFNLGFIKIDSTTKSGGDQPLEFKTSSSHNGATGKLFGSVDLKYKFPKYGVTLTEKWNTENVLGTEVVVEDQGMEGLKLTFDSAFNPHLSKRSGKVKADVKNDRFHFNGDVSLESSPHVSGAVVAEHNGILFGAQGSYDTKNSKLAHTGFAIGYKQGNYAVHTFVNDNVEFGGNLYHQVDERLQLAAMVGWNANESTTRYAVASKYQLEKGTFVQSKINSDTSVTVGMTHSLSPSLKMTVSGMCFLNNFTEGGNKFGFGIEYSN